jgi:hypothetical protein
MTADPSSEGCKLLAVASQFCYLGDQCLRQGHQFGDPDGGLWVQAVFTPRLRPYVQLSKLVQVVLACMNVQSQLGLFPN